MIHYTTGDLLKSDASTLVNTVNCEGYMGKGIAYQFKLQFPENNADYIKACKSGMLKVGKLHVYEENGKTIINFPTKDKWREKSKMEYIKRGIDELNALIRCLNITSIAIPPLGSGNGGLVWNEVKNVIEERLSGVSDSVDIFIYEPSKNYSSQVTIEPQLSLSALVLIEIKQQLCKFNMFRLQKAAYFTDLFSEKKYFKFQKHEYGPYAHSIDTISKKIREFKSFHKTTSTKEIKSILYNKLISETVENNLSKLTTPIERACAYVNSIESDNELECLSTICFLINEKDNITEDQILQGFKEWSVDKAERFSENDILVGINSLYNAGVIEKSLLGYIINTQYNKVKEY